MLFQNYVNIEGFLSSNVEINEKNGKKYARFSVCYNESYYDESSKEWKSVPNFFNCVAFDKAAEKLTKYEKGMPVSVIGKLISSQYKDGEVTRYSVSIKVSAVRKFELDANENTETSESADGASKAFDVF